MTTALYDQIGVGYDATRRADAYLAARLADLLKLRPGRAYIDVACGTGNYTIALTERSGQFTGVDVSREMLAAARQKTPDGLDIDWRLASIEKTPFADGAFDGATCTLALHHLPDLHAAFREVARMLRPETGRLVIFTSTPEQMARYWLAHYFPKMMALSAQDMPSFDTVADALGQAGFQRIETEPYHVAPNLTDMFLYSGKHRPELYLNARFRSGISSFANLATRDEVEAGLVKLAGDIASGAIADIISAAQHEGGDYLFISADRQI